MAEPDPVAAIVSFLLADAGVAAQVDSRVFGGELPTEENGEMPRLAVIVNPAGGGLIGRSYQQYGDVRVDVDCYGAAKPESWGLYLALEQALKHLQRAVHEDVLLHWARASTRGRTIRDPRTDWPVTVSTWQVMASEIPIS